jgi:hypothetical protein
MPVLYSTECELWFCCPSPFQSTLTKLGLGSVGCGSLLSVVLYYDWLSWPLALQDVSGYYLWHCLKTIV